MPVPKESAGQGTGYDGDSSVAGSAAGETSSGTTTGGFETMLGKLVIKGNLATPEEVELCTELLRESEQAEEPHTLADLLVVNEFLTKRQIDRLKREFEAQKSTQQIPGYKIKQKLGSGAMATVFLGRQLSLDRLVAIKVLPKKFSDNDRFIERFYKEGRAAAQLNHINIVGAYDVGKAGDHHYFVMEYVDGETVFDRIVKRKQIPETEALDIIRQVAAALKHAHERGFIHRDIKPKNIMINKKGVVKLADLGLARAVSDKEAAKAEAGRAYGTPYYISPEQIRGEVKIGPPADIYGLGATFYHMVTGRVPYEGKNPSSVMHKHLKSDLVPPDHRNPKLSAGIAQIIEMMLAKGVRDRYHTVDDLIEDLDLVAAGASPHFAKGHLDVGKLTEIATAAAAMPEQPPAVQHTSSQQSLMGNPAFLAVAAIAVLSVLINIVLAIVLAS